MEVDFDPAKIDRNIRERQLSFERAAEVDFNEALIFADTPQGVRRNTLHSTVLSRLPAACALFHRNQKNGIRVISFRKANAREAIRHGKPQTID